MLISCHAKLGSRCVTPQLAYRHFGEIASDRDGGAACRPARNIYTMLSTVKAANARLDADCGSTLSWSDLGGAEILMLPVFDLRDRLLTRKLLKLDEAMVYLRGTRLCELLLSLLRRWPWAELLAPMHKDLMLLVRVLRSLSAFLGVAACVRSSQQVEAYAETSKRCHFSSVHLAALQAYQPGTSC